MKIIFSYSVLKNHGYLCSNNVELEPDSPEILWGDEGFRSSINSFLGLGGLCLALLLISSLLLCSCLSSETGRAGGLLASASSSSSSEDELEEDEEDEEAWAVLPFSSTSCEDDRSASSSSSSSEVLSYSEESGLSDEDSELDLDEDELSASKRNSHRNDYLQKTIMKKCRCIDLILNLPSSDESEELLSLEESASSSSSPSSSPLS